MKFFDDEADKRSSASTREADDQLLNPQLMHDVLAASGSSPSFEEAGAFGGASGPGPSLQLDHQTSSDFNASTGPVSVSQLHVGVAGSCPLATAGSGAGPPALHGQGPTHRTSVACRGSSGARAVAPTGPALITRRHSVGHIDFLPGSSPSDSDVLGLNGTTSSATAVHHGVGTTSSAPLVSTNNGTAGAPQRAASFDDPPAAAGQGVPARGNTYPNLVPNLVLRDYYAIPNAEEDPDRDVFLSNLQEAVYAYDALHTHERYIPPASAGADDVSEGGHAVPVEQPAALYQLIHNVERTLGPDHANVQRLTPELVATVWEGLRHDQRAILREIKLQYGKVRGEAPVAKLGRRLVDDRRFLRWRGLLDAARTKIIPAAS